MPILLTDFYSHPYLGFYFLSVMRTSSLIALIPRTDAQSYSSLRLKHTVRLFLQHAQAHSANGPCPSHSHLTNSCSLRFQMFGHQELNNGPMMNSAFLFLSETGRPF